VSNGKPGCRRLYVLLPLREKVAAKPTDEGSHRPFRLGFNHFIGDAGATPHPISFGGHLLPQGEKDSGGFARTHAIALPMKGGRPGYRSITSIT
jgi:hypothetical protein